VGAHADNQEVTTGPSEPVPAPTFAAEVLDALPDATAILDRSGMIVAVNRAWRMFALDNGGRSDTTGVGTSYLDVCERAADGGCAEAAEVLIGLRSVLAGATVESDREYPCPSPTVDRWFNSRITPIGGATGGAVASHVNITRRVHSEQELTRQASHDPLTGLANRVLFTEVLTRALISRPGREAVPDVGVLYLDLDLFKAVNDTYGHGAGDEVLLASAHRLSASVRPNDTVARLGGDEFAICAPRITTEGLDGLAGRITEALAEPLRIHGRSLRVGVSVGSHLAGAGDSAAEAVRLADRAMYRVKVERSSDGGRETAGTEPHVD